MAAEALSSLLQAARAAGKTVVQCHGCFDIVHPGHVRYLRFARELGDILVVSLTGDAGVDKGAERPYIPQELRAENLAALEFVDWVVIDPHPTAAEVLECLRPDVYVKGREYARASDPRFVREREIVERHGGRVVFHSGDVVFSSTRLLESMVRDEALDEDRLRALCERSGIDAAAMHQVVERFPKLRVVIVGDLIRERYVFCDAGAVAQDAPVMSLRRLGEREYWGGAVAVARQVQALGATPCVLTASGRNAAARRVAERFAELQIAGELLRYRPAVVRRTTFVADDEKLFELTEGESSPLDSSAERRVLELLAERLADADLLIWCDHGFGMLTSGLVRAAGALAQARGVRVAGYASGQRSQLSALEQTDLLTTTERSLREAMHDMSSGLPAVVWNLLRSTRGRAAIVSLRKRGLMGFDGGPAHHAGGNGSGEPGALSERLKSEFVPSVARHYVDWLGAEAAVITAAALTLAAGGSLPLATYAAASAETLAVSRPGGQPVAAAELAAWFHNRPELRPQNRFLPDSARLSDIAMLAPPLATGAAHG
jgi:rfaE bifunctional protein nucleotidyltransferase chain/domain